MSRNNEPCLARSTPIDLRPVKLHYSAILLDFDRCGGTCNTPNDLLLLICLIDYLFQMKQTFFKKVFNIVTAMHASKS